MVDYRARTGCIIGISSRFSLTRRSVCCVFSLESPHEGDSNKYAQHTIVNLKKENHPKLSQVCGYGFFQGSQERVRNSGGKRAISVRATEGLLYYEVKD